MRRTTWTTAQTMAMFAPSRFSTVEPVATATPASHGAPYGAIATGARAARNVARASGGVLYPPRAVSLQRGQLKSPVL